MHGPRNKSRCVLVLLSLYFYLYSSLWCFQQSVKNIGNINANAKWNPNESMHPPPTNLEESERDSEMEKYIRAKYESKRFMNRAAPSTIETSTSSSSSGNPYASASSASPSTTRLPKSKTTSSDFADPSQTVKLGFGRESRVEFSLTPGGGDMFDEIVQQNKRVPPRSRTAPIPEPVVRDVKPAAPPVPPVPAIPSRSVSTQPLGGAGIGLSGMGAGAAATQSLGMGQMGMNQMGAGQMGTGQMGGGMGSGAGTTGNPVWGDMMALQTGGPIPIQQASPMQQNNPYASLGAAPSLPSTLANRMSQARSFTAPASGIGGAPNPFFQNQATAQQQQPFATGSTGSSMLSVPTGNSFGSMSSGGMIPAATGGSFGSVSSGSFGGMGSSPSGAFGGGSFGTTSTGGSFGVSPGGAFGTSPNGMQSTGFGTSPSGMGTTTLSPNSGQGFSQTSPFQQNSMSPFQQNSTSPFGGTGGSSGPSMSAFGAAMSPGGGASNSPYAQGGMSNSPYQQTNTSNYQPSSSMFQSTGGSQFQPSSGQFQQSTPSYNGLSLQSNSGTAFQPNASLYPQQSNSPYQSTNTAFAPGQMNTNPFGSFGSTGGAANTNPFGQQQQQQQGQFQFQGQGQGWGGM